ncbi:MAG: hypothetical protein WCW35_08345 [Bacteroidota bacterium]
MNGKSSTREYKYRGPILTLTDVKKKVVMEQLVNNQPFQEFITEWVAALMRFETDQRKVA